MNEATAPRPGDELYLPEEASLPRRLRVAWSALRILADDPKNTVAGELLNLCLDKEVYARLGAALARHDEGRKLLAERPALDAGALDLEALERLPDGTLGREFARYFRDKGISPFESPFTIRNDVEYLAKRYRETHDLAHVVTGYDTDVVGEMELQAFMLGNLRIPTAAMILTFAAVNVIPNLKGLSVRAYLRKLRAAYVRGLAAGRLLDVRYENLWEKPVPVVRRMLALSIGSA